MRITPAPCLIDRDTISVREAIEKMAKEKTSYILLTDKHDILKGIFTDRDLLFKHEYLMKNDNIDRPIYHIMSRSVKTLSFYDMHLAPELMFKQKIRHIPILQYDEEQEKDLVAGIITSKTIFESIVKTHGLPSFYGGVKNKEKNRSYGVVSANGQLYKLLQSVFERSSQTTIQRIRIADIQSQSRIEQFSKQNDALVVDVAAANFNSLKVLIKTIIENPELETVALIYEKSSEDNILGLINHLKQKGLVLAYQRPIDITALLSDLNSENEKS